MRIVDEQPHYLLLWLLKVNENIKKGFVRRRAGKYLGVKMKSEIRDTSLFAVQTKEERGQNKEGKEEKKEIGFRVVKRDKCVFISRLAEKLATECIPTHLYVHGLTAGHFLFSSHFRAWLFFSFVPFQLSCIISLC